MKRFVQFLGLLWFSFGLVGALGYIVGFGSGLNVLTLSDVLGVLGWTTMMVLGLGLLTLREWGRLGSLAVVGLSALWLGVWTVRFRGLGFDLFGILLLLLAMSIYGAVFYLLVRFKQSTSSEEAQFTRRRTVGIVLCSLVAVTLLYLTIFLGHPRPPDSFPVLEASEFQFPLAGSRWKLQTIVPVGANDGVFDNARGKEFVLEVSSADGVLQLSGIPPLARIRVRLDPARNVLLLNDWAFRGELIEGQLAYAGNAEFKGFAFENAFGAISGELFLYQLEGDRVFLAVRELSIYGITRDHFWIGERLENLARRDAEFDRPLREGANQLPHRRPTGRPTMRSTDHRLSSRRSEVVLLGSAFSRVQPLSPAAPVSFGRSAA